MREGHFPSEPLPLPADGIRLTHSDHGRRDEGRGPAGCDALTSSPAGRSGQEPDEAADTPGVAPWL